MSKTEYTAEQLDRAMLFLETVKTKNGVVGTFAWNNLCEAIRVPLAIRWNLFEALEEAGRLESFVEPETDGHWQYRFTGETAVSAKRAELDAFTAARENVLTAERAYWAELERLYGRRANHVYWYGTPEQKAGEPNSELRKLRTALVDARIAKDAATCAYYGWEPAKTSVTREEQIDGRF